ncbi:MAG TPA: cytochrome c oxidase assembly protein [Chloroflexota bacterium]|nr:cytochrome c oxidase assembly protein [Chloroflexota bacterium]
MTRFASGRSPTIAAPTLVAASLALAASGHGHPALAATGAPPTPGDVWTAWAWDPLVLLGLVVAAAVYARGLRTYWRRVGTGRGIRTWQAAAYAAGLAAIAVALVSPLDALSDALFAAHMVQHLILMLVAAPLLVLGAPLVPALWSLRRGQRQAVGRWWRGARPVRAAWRWLSQPGIVWGLYAAAVWLWHLPGPYQAALASTPIHALEHASLLASALLFWWTALHPGRPGRLGHGAGVLYVFTAGFQGGLLGVLLTFAQTPWYPAYTSREAAWGLSPIDDQQLAGLLMWIPAGLVHLLAALGLFFAWLSASEREARRREQAAEV